MSDKFTNGAQWQRMCERLLDLCDSLGEAAQALPFVWQPGLPATWSQEQAWKAWHQQELQNIEAIHAAARELVQDGRLVDPAPEVVYFLGVRLQAAIQHLESVSAISMDRPVSLVPFPPVSADSYAAWLLTEWGDDHAGMLVFPEDVCVRRTPVPDPTDAGL